MEGESRGNGRSEMEKEWKGKEGPCRGMEGAPISCSSNECYMFADM